MRNTMWITWGTDTAHQLPRLIASRESGPLFLSEHRPGPHRQATTDPRDICPETGRARLGYDRARVSGGWTEIDTLAVKTCSPVTYDYF